MPLTSASNINFLGTTIILQHVRNFLGATVLASTDPSVRTLSSGDDPAVASVLAAPLIRRPSPHRWPAFVSVGPVPLEPWHQGRTAPLAPAQRSPTARSALVKPTGPTTAESRAAALLTIAPTSAAVTVRIPGGGPLGSHPPVMLAFPAARPAAI